MSKRERKQFVFDVTSGSPARMLRKAEEALPRLRQEMVRLQETMQAKRAEFKHYLEAWTSTEVEGYPRPVAREADLREAWIAGAGATVLTIAELAMACFISIVFLVNPVALLLLAAVAIFAMKAGLLTLLRNDQQPQQTRRSLLRWIILPSLVATMLAIGALSIARLGGPLALLLLPFLNLSLCLASLSCLVLAAGLFALAHLGKWGRHAERRFNAVEKEAVESLRVLRLVEKIVAELQAGKRPAGNLLAAMPGAGNSPTALQRQMQDAPAPLSEKARAARHGGGSWAALALLAALGSSGCSLAEKMSAGAATPAVSSATPNAVADATLAASSAPVSSSTIQPANAGADETRLEIWLDWSLSTAAQAYRELVHALIEALPELALKHHVTRVKVYQFGGDGWNAAELLSLELPAPKAVAIDEVSQLITPLRKEQEQQAAGERARQVREKLAALTPEKLLPENAIEPPCTDVQGALVRIGETARSQRRLVFLISDLDDSCSHRLQPVSLSQANAALVVVVLPEEQSADAQHKAQPRADVVWKQRRDELLGAAPGAIVIPYFGDPISAAAEALSKLGNQSPVQYRER